jgi:hypothetical protein
MLLFNFINVSSDVITYVHANTHPVDRCDKYVQGLQSSDRLSSFGTECGASTSDQHKGIRRHGISLASGVRQIYKPSGRRANWQVTGKADNAL